MSIVVACPGCGKELSVPDSARGKRGKCNGCGSAIEVPSVPTVPPPPAAAEPTQEPDGWLTRHFSQILCVAGGLLAGLVLAAVISSATKYETPEPEVVVERVEVPTDDTPAAFVALCCVSLGSMVFGVWLGRKSRGGLIGEHDAEAAAADWYDEEPTERQIRYAHHLGISKPERCSRGELSERIDEAQAEKRG